MDFCKFVRIETICGINMIYNDVQKAIVKKFEISAALFSWQVWKWQLKHSMRSLVMFACWIFGLCAFCLLFSHYVYNRQLSDDRIW